MKWFLCALMLTATMLSAATPEEVAATVVVYNAADPDSASLAESYGMARGIPAANLIGLKTPRSEEISRNEYDSLIAVPLREALVARGFWKVTRDLLNRTILFSSTVRYVAIIRGIPLKIRQEYEPYPGDSVVQDPPYGAVNAASVDSELTVLGLFTPQISGILRNPLRDPAAGVAVPPWILMVSRLDGPTAGDVRHLISSTLAAERDGLKGWGYIDLRFTKEKGYVLGEEWIAKAGEALRNHGIPVIEDDLPEPLQEGFPVTDAAAYFGWYAENINGPFAGAGFHFVSGAVAVHLHSFSASGLRDPNRWWTAPLITRGACASLGNVYEPYLPFTANLGIFCSSLLDGKTLAESHCCSLAAFSWMNVCVGDPLYRPYAWFSGASDSVPPKDIWSAYREVILRHGGDVLAAASDLEELAKKTGDPMPIEALGNEFAAKGLQERAAKAFQRALGFAKERRIRLRLLVEQSRCLEVLGKGKEALAIIKSAEEMVGGEPERRWISGCEQRLKESSP